MTIAMMASAISLTLAAPIDAPPPPPAAVLVHGLAYFRPGEATRIRPTGLDPIAYLAARKPADAHAFVRAHADTAGDAEANRELSLRRARSLADELTAMGVSPDRLTLIACGEEVLPVPTPDNVAEPLNRLAEFDWGPSPPQPPKGCTAQAYRQGGTLGRAGDRAIFTLSRAEAEAMSTADLARRLFPDLAPQAAFRSSVSAYSPFGREGLTNVSIFTRPNDLGDGVCGAVRHSLSISRYYPEHTEATATTPMALDRREDTVIHFMRPTSEPDAAKPCAEQDPERFYGVRPLSVQLAPPYPLTAAKLLRAAAANGADIPIDCTDDTPLRACDTPGAALKAFQPERVITVSRGAGPGATCPGDDAAAGCWRFMTDLYGPSCGAWIVVVSVKASRMTGLRMRRSCIVFH